MGISILLARFLGLLFVIITAGVLLNLKNYQKVMEDFFENSALVYIGGVMALVFGIFLVMFHNIWALNWTVLITILGWSSLIKGILLIVFPNMIFKMTEMCRKSTAVLAVHVIIILALGVFLTIMGYFV
ncbi:MAG: hypothetical protein WBC99_06435 [Candidatus Omnitrophota bacterium]